MAKKKTATAETVFAQLLSDHDALSEAEQRKLRDMIANSSELANGVAAFMILERGLQNLILKKKHSERSRTEDNPARNDAIVADREAGKTLGEIQKKHGISMNSVRGILRRRKNNSSMR